MSAIVRSLALLFFETARLTSPESHYTTKVSFVSLILFLKLSECLKIVTGDFPGATMVRNLLASAGDIIDISSIPKLGRFAGEGNGNSLRGSCLDNPMDREVWGISLWSRKRVRHD